MVLTLRLSAFSQTFRKTKWKVLISLEFNTRMSSRMNCVVGFLTFDSPSGVIREFFDGPTKRKRGGWNTNERQIEILL